MLISLGIAALAAVAVLIFTAGSVVSNKRAARAASDELNKYKFETERKVIAAQAKIKNAEIKIADANEKAAEATREAARLGVRIEELPTYVAEKEAQLNSLAASMARSAEELDRARESAQISQTKAETALDTLRKEAEGRTLTKVQSQKIIASLHGKPFSIVFVQSDPGDVEAYSYAMEIHTALKDAGLHTEYQPWPTTFVWFNEPGLFVVTSGSVPKEQSEMLLNALNAAGLAAKEATMSQDMAPQAPAPGRLSIVIWKKPLPKVTKPE